MIFLFTDNADNAAEWKDNDLAELTDNMVSHGHKIAATARWMAKLDKAIAEHSGTNARERYRKSQVLPITRLERRFLRTIDVGKYTYADLYYLANERAKVLVENSQYEWPLYKKLIEHFTSGSRFSNVFKELEYSFEKKGIEPLHCGGFQAMAAQLSALEKGTPNSIAKLKTAIVFDRDTGNENSFSEEKRSLFRILSGKDNTTLQNSDIYKLKPEGGWMWHMWYKREIENYFPLEQYESHNIDTCKLPRDEEEFSYTKINGTTAMNYSKHMLEKLVEDLDWNRFLSMQKRFSISETEEVTEMELLFLKWVSTI